MSASALAVESVSSRPVLVVASVTPNEEVERTLLQLRVTVILKYVLRRREYFEQMSRMVEAMMPLTPVPLPVEVQQARRNAEMRVKILHEFGALTSAQVGEWAGSKSPNRAALAHKWKSERRIFSVPHQGTNYFPGFQFDAEGQPIPVIADVIRILRELSPWELVGWFTRNDGYLGGRRAVELLKSDPERVIFAAEREAEGIVF